MSSVPYDARRRGLLQQHTPLDLSANWDVPQVVKVRAVRSLVLSGDKDFTAHGMLFRRPVGVVEMVGTRVGNCPTTMLVVFTDHPDDGIGRFRLERGEALGVLLLPVSAFSGFMHVAGGSSVYVRLGGTGADNAVANDATMLNA